MKQFLIQFAMRMLLKWILENAYSVDNAQSVARHTREEGDNMFSRKGSVYRYVKSASTGEKPVYLLNLATELAIALDEMKK